MYSLLFAIVKDGEIHRQDSALLLHVEKTCIYITARKDNRIKRNTHIYTDDKR